MRFAFGLHLHQPVGNFDHVFREHVDEVYLPFLEAVAGSALLPASLHVSGPLLEWMEAHDSRYLDLVGRRVADGDLELLLSGFYEPVLAALGREDRLEQIAWMREALERRFGVRARGLWLTERVWEPDLARDLADAGVDYVLLDDRHFLTTGLAREELHQPYRTESHGRTLDVLPIDEHLRYLIPFRPVQETSAYLRRLRAEGRPLAVLADDGEKFGGWPGTRKWVYGEGWLRRFIESLEALKDAGEVVPCTFGQAIDVVPSGGLVYLPTASYREMEAWSLPAEPRRRLRALEREVGEARLRGPDGAFLRGGHWKGFLSRYREANRMHKKTAAVSSLCRRRGDPPEARRAVARAQCNDAYWHGVFGGLYLPHLRAAVWKSLAAAEARLREGEGLDVERLDLYGDGHEVLWVHSGSFSAVVSPARGGAVEELTVFRTGVNLVDVLTRRREAYHLPKESPTRDESEGNDQPSRDEAEENGSAPHPDDTRGTPTIHELEGGFSVEDLPPVDPEDRALLTDRILPPDLAEEAYREGRWIPVRSWARTALDVKAVRTGEGTVEMVLLDPSGGLEKRLRFGVDGSLVVDYRWSAAGLPPGSRFAPELSLAGDAEVAVGFDPEPTAVWRYPIETVSTSERALERTVQGRSLTPLWDAGVTGARVSVRAEREDG